MRYILCLVFIIVLGVVPSASADDEGGHICADCGREIGRVWIQAEGKYYHPQHFTCAYCDEPIESEYRQFQERNYHESCYNKIAERCEVCGKVLEGEYLIDHWGAKFHRWHQDEVERCEYCLRILMPGISGDSKRYDDGRQICGICLPKAISDEDRAQRLVGEVRGHLNFYGIELETDDFDLHLVDLRELQRRSGRRDHTLKGFADYRSKRNFLGMTLSRDIDVYILHGMPEADAVSTIAHELMHVWQYEHGRMDNDPAFCEGSCNYAAYLVMQRYDGDDFAFTLQSMERSDDMIYGEGFRRVKTYVETVGIEAWLTQLATESSLPPGF